MVRRFVKSPSVSPIYRHPRAVIRAEVLEARETPSISGAGEDVHSMPVLSTPQSSQVAHPLLVGLSMHAEVDIHETGGAQLAAAARANPVWAVLARPSQDAEARVQAIIAANLGTGR